MKSDRLLVLGLLIFIHGSVWAQDGSSGSDGSGIPTVIVPAGSSGGALAAMALVPPDYADGILSISARHGAPDPAEWVIQARQNGDLSTLKKFVIAGGQLISSGNFLNPMEAFRGEDYLSLESLQVDSSSAWNIAAKDVLTRGETLAYADFVLTVPEKHAAPEWRLTCYGKGGKSLGQIRILASTGAILGQ